MLYYRLYFMHPTAGNIERFAEFEAPDDQAAIALAREHIGQHPLELWCERRKVAQIGAFATASRKSGNVVERAFELARSGECRRLAEIHQQLRREGFVQIQAHLDGRLIKGQLSKLMADSGASAARQAAE